MSACSTRRYTLQDLHNHGMSEDDKISMQLVRGNAISATATVSADNLQDFMRLVVALSGGVVSTDVEFLDAVTSYRRIDVYGPSNSFFSLCSVGTINKQYYIVFPYVDEIVYRLSDSDYKAILSVFDITLPFPEELDKRLFVEPIKDYLSQLGHGTLSAGEQLPWIPMNVHFTFPEVRTVDDFTMGYPAEFVDVEPPDGEYIAVLPCGHYYQMTLGVRNVSGKWEIVGGQVSRSNVSMYSQPKENWRWVVYGPSITDIDGWGMHQLKRVELYEATSGQVLWEADGLYPIGTGTTWSSDTRYAAITHETGRAENRCTKVLLLDTSTMHSASLAVPLTELGAQTQALYWFGDTQLLLYCHTRGNYNDGAAVLYDTQTQEYIVYEGTW